MQAYAGLRVPGEHPASGFHPSFATGNGAHLVQLFQWNFLLQSDPRPIVIRLHLLLQAIGAAALLVPIQTLKP